MMRPIGWCVVYGDDIVGRSTVAETRRAAMAMSVMTSGPELSLGLATDEEVDARFRQKHPNARVLRVFVEVDETG